MWSPAKAGAPELSEVPQVEVVELADALSDQEFDVILDPGTVVIGYESRISAIAITAKADD